MEVGNLFFIVCIVKCFVSKYLSFSSKHNAVNFLSSCSVKRKLFASFVDSFQRFEIDDSIDNHACIDDTK